MSTFDQTPPQWGPDPRYAPTVSPQPTYVPPTKKKRGWIKWAVIGGLLLLAFGACTAIGIGASNSINDSINAPVSTSDGSVDNDPRLTTGQDQAVRTAQTYLQTFPFSRKGLIRQLSSSAGSGFSVADSTFAVNHIKVDWKAQAVKAAQNYLDTMPFSRAGLIRQLSSAAGDQYTVAEATYAADKVGL